MIVNRNFNNHFQRIVVVGTSGSGKTTLAQQISEGIGIPHVELDALHWGPNWTETPNDLFLERIAKVLQGKTWVVDGNYSEARDIIWGSADSLVFLDYTFWLVMSRIVRRTFRRVFSQEVLWNGNRERFWEQFFTRESMFWWVIKTYSRRRREYPLLFRQPEYAHLQVIHLKSPQATDEWLKELVDLKKVRK